MREGAKTIVCIDSYENSELRGRCYDAHGEAYPFSSLSRFLLWLHEALEDGQSPQAYTAHRTFCTCPPACTACAAMPGVRRGEMATFEIQVLYRQHSSWQGVITWQERKEKHAFRSALELILLMDSALQQANGWSYKKELQNEIILRN